MRLGFIGTGKIASSVITGVCTSKISFRKILISRRNKNIAQKLKKRFRKVNIAETNQEIVDKCNWVFLAVTPKVGEKILPKLKTLAKEEKFSFIRFNSAVQNLKTNKYLHTKFEALSSDE